MSSIEDQQIDEYLTELDSLAADDYPQDGMPDEKVKGPPKRKRKKYTKYRYRTRMIKGSILPVLFGLISINMLNTYTRLYPKYYELNIMIILAGFLLGFGAITGITMVNMARAKRHPKSGCELNMKVGFVAFIPFIFIFMMLALFDTLTTAWQFSTGFFLAAIFPILIVSLYEVGSKGKFFVREHTEDPSRGRKLVFVQ